MTSRQKRQVFDVEIGERYRHAVNFLRDYFLSKQGVRPPARTIAEKGIEALAEKVNQMISPAEARVAGGPDPRRFNCDWAVDRDKNVTYLGPAWYFYTGQTPAEALDNRGCERAVHPDDRARSVAEFEQAFEERRAFATEYRLRLANGDYIRMRSHGGPVYGVHHDFLGFVGSAFEVQSSKPVLLRNLRAISNSA